MKSASRRSTAGFSLLELLLCLTLGAILLGAASPSLARAWSALQLRAAAVQVAAAFTRARIAAMLQGRPWRVTCVAAAGIDTGPLGAPGTREDLPAGAVIAHAGSGGEVRFRPNGLAENATFVLELGGLRRRVVVNQRGKVTLE